MGTQQEHDQAVEHGKQMRATTPYAIAARYDSASDRVIVDLSSGFSLSFERERAQGIENATAGDLNEIEISPSGFGVRFPKLDADLWVPGMLQGIFGTQRWEAAWQEAHRPSQAA